MVTLVVFGCVFSLTQQEYEHVFVDICMSELSYSFSYNECLAGKVSDP